VWCCTLRLGQSPMLYDAKKHRKNQKKMNIKKNVVINKRKVELVYIIIIW